MLLYTYEVDCKFSPEEEVHTERGFVYAENYQDVMDELAESFGTDYVYSIKIDALDSTVVMRLDDEEYYRIMEEYKELKEYEEWSLAEEDEEE